MATTPQITILKDEVTVTPQVDRIDIEIQQNEVVVSTLPTGYNIQLPATASADKHFSQTFTNQTSVVVSHNLVKKPAVTVFDSAGTEYEVKIVHDSVNQLTATWDTVLTGTITCN